MKIEPDEHNDFAPRIRTGDLTQRLRFISLLKSIEEMRTWVKYTPSELIVNIAENFGNRRKNRS
jgi:hypothetical protein